ncbi:DUF6308 family protein [Iamia sp.]|uniref:DUF6308 family protein n=1 Tax=Iamia sp. TaxID=2722710 RepID=UPI002CE7B22D|nr:DUF6308 family protein [Iamia sp.]HXH57648.1 DUF6308 family protein [Iamia sp.]
MSDQASFGFDLVLAGHPIEGARDSIRRYCGLPWTGGAPETWAFAYYDQVDTARADRVDPVDVLAASALQRGLSRDDMTFFAGHGSRSTPGLIEQWLFDVPSEARLESAGPKDLWALEQLTTWEAAPGLALLTKVLHRKRPNLIPLIDRATIDWYRPVTAERRAERAWPALMRAIGEDLAMTGVGAANRFWLASMAVEIAKETGRQVSFLRLVDISIWMGANG